jgi:hypothetical protein
MLKFPATSTGGGSILSMLLIKYLKQPKIPIIFGTIITSVGVGLVSWAVQADNHSAIDGFMALCGVGVGVGFGPLASAYNTFPPPFFDVFSNLTLSIVTVHARFSQPEKVVSVVVSLNMFFRTAGGTVGLAQLGTVLEAKARHYLTSHIPPGSSIDPSAFEGSVQSIEIIDSLSPSLQAFVKDAFRSGVRWSFISLIPWCAIAAVLVLFLSNIDWKKRQMETGGIAIGDSDVSDASGVDKPGSSPTADPRPKLGFPGPISAIIYMVRLRAWNKRQSQREREMAEVEAQKEDIREP